MAATGDNARVPDEAALSIQSYNSSNEMLLPVSPENNFSTRTGKAQRRTVFVGGLVSGKPHMDSLMAVVQELLPNYFVCLNPTNGQPWVRSRVRQLVSSAEAMLFFMNEFTLNDRRCLLCVQYAWEQFIPIVVVRHPRMKLIMNPMPDQARVQRWADSVNSGAGSLLDQRTEPDMGVLQDVLYEGYQQSLPYSHFQHQSGMRLLRARLAHVMGIITPNHSQHSDNNNQLYEQYTLKLPPIPPTSSTMKKKPSSAGLAGRQSRSRSLGGAGRSRDRRPPKSATAPAVRQARPTSRTRPASQGPAHAAVVTRSSHFQPITLADSLKMNRSFEKQHNSCCSSNEDNDSNSSDMYHETQYLLFPIADRSHKPRLIRFPSDIVNTPTNTSEPMEVESIWGSDTSYEEEFNMAQDLKGDLEVASLTSSPAPYIEPL